MHPPLHGNEARKQYGLPGLGLPCARILTLTIGGRQMAVSVFASFFPHEQSEGAFVELLSGMVTATRAEPGCRRYDLYKSVGGSTAYHLFEISEHYTDYRARVADMLTEPVGVILLEPVYAQG